jgi:hypothetical protein
MVYLGGVTVDGRGGLCAHVAVVRVEVECAHVVGAVRAFKFHAAFNALDGVEAVHTSSVVACAGMKRNGSGTAKVMEN